MKRFARAKGTLILRVPRLRSWEQPVLSSKSAAQDPPTESEPMSTARRQLIETYHRALNPRMEAGRHG